eukprot:scaffold64_cov89-Cylindrotheca_fusiformis.AAC.1
MPKSLDLLATRIVAPNDRLPKPPRNATPTRWPHVPMPKPHPAEANASPSPNAVPLELDSFQLLPRRLFLYVPLPVNCRSMQALHSALTIHWSTNACMVPPFTPTLAESLNTKR